MSFANQLKKAMVAQCMTQKQLCEAIHVGKSSVSSYLSGNQMPKLEIQMAIADALDCTVEYLNGESNEKGEYLCNVSIKEAARRLGKSEQFVRVALQRGVAPFGFAVRSDKGKYSYHISPKKLDEYMVV
jgi:transcriptional regulator with XRE-family HTH domain